MRLQRLALDSEKEKKRRREARVPFVSEPRFRLLMFENAYIKTSPSYLKTVNYKNEDLHLMYLINLNLDHKHSQFSDITT